MTNQWVSTVFRENGGRKVFNVPSDRISRADVLRVVNQRGRDPGDRILYAACQTAPRHDEESLRAKFKAINSVGGANIYGLSEFVKAIDEWGRQYPGRLSRLISDGSPTQACQLIGHVKRRRRISYTSAISKFLAFHNPDRWPIYDEWVRKYLWALTLTVDMEGYWITPNHVLHGEPGWSGLENAESLKDYNLYVPYIDQLWDELCLPYRDLPIRDKEYVFWRLARERSVLRRKRSQPLRLRT